MRVASYGMDWNELFDRYDTDGSGTLNFNEFEHAVRFFLRISEQDISFERLEQLFGLINSESTGELGVAQFREFLQEVAIMRKVRGGWLGFVGGLGVWGCCACVFWVSCAFLSH